MGSTALLLVIGLTVAACGSGGSGLEVSNARVGEPTGPHATLYFTATSNGEEDRLISATTDVATSVELHENVMNEDGTMMMHPLSGIDLPADGSLVLEPGGYHLMLVDVDRLAAGETIDVDLTWENAGAMTISAEVVEPVDVIEHGG